MSWNEPAAANVIVHEPSATAALHWMLPALTVTVPLGVPLAGPTAATVKLTVTDSPVTEGSGVSAVIVVVVAPLLTVCGVLADPPAKLPSPS